MKFIFETKYNAESMSIMAKALRRTMRKKHSRLSHIFGWIVVIIGVLLIITNFAFDFKAIVSLFAVNNLKQQIQKSCFS